MAKIFLVNFNDIWSNNIDNIDNIDNIIKENKNVKLSILNFLYIECEVFISKSKLLAEIIESITNLKLIIFVPNSLLR